MRSRASRSSLLLLAAPRCCRRATHRRRARARRLSADAAARFAALALKCLHQEYPNHISHTLNSDADARPPRAAHAGLLRLLRLALGRARPLAAGAAAAPVPARAVRRAGARGAGAQLHRSRTSPAKSPTCSAAGRASFERPYGLAWLLHTRRGAAQLGRPGRTALVGDARAAGGRGRGRACRAGCPKLHYPIRIGEHDQTAFSFGLVWDWAGVARGRRRCAQLLTRCRAALLPRRPQLPARLRALGRGLPVAVPGGGGLHAPRARRRAIRAPGCGAFLPQIPARAAGQPHVAAARGRDRSRGPEARAHRRPEPQPRLDARGHRARPAARRSRAVGAAGAPPPSTAPPRCRR